MLTGKERIVALGFGRNVCVLCRLETDGEDEASSTVERPYVIGKGGEKEE